MKYCLITTKSHPFVGKSISCLDQLNSLIKREGGKGRLFPNIDVLDLDKAEIKAAKRDKRPTRSSMDIFFGIAKETDGKLKEQSFVLAEFKFNVKSPVGAGGKTSLEKKVKDSINLLDREFTITPTYYFIFDSKLKKEAEAYFERIYINKNIYIPLSEEDFYKLYFSK